MVTKYFINVIMMDIEKEVAPCKTLFEEDLREITLEEYSKFLKVGKKVNNREVDKYEKKNDM